MLSKGCWMGWEPPRKQANAREISTKVALQVVSAHVGSRAKLDPYIRINPCNKELCEVSEHKSVFADMSNLCPAGNQCWWLARMQGGAIAGCVDLISVFT